MYSINFLPTNNVRSRIEVTKKSFCHRYNRKINYIRAGSFGQNNRYVDYCKHDKAGIFYI